MKNLSEQYLNMSESAFEVSDNPQRGDSEGDTWKKEEVTKLGKLLGLKVPKDFTWGSFDTELNGQPVDIKADRNKPAIFITVGNDYQNRIRIKGSLSSAQIKNLRKKMEKQASDKDHRQNINSKISDARMKLAKAGITMGHDKNMTVDDIDLYFRDGKVEASGSIYYDSRGVSIKTKGAEKEIDKLLANIKKDLVAKQKKFLNAEAKAEKKLEEIKAYFELVDSRNK